MINFTRSFDLAWERMMVILFRPFDLGKWFVIGFSAFLAGLLAGGNGVNASYRQSYSNRNNWSTSYNWSETSNWNGTSHLTQHTTSFTGFPLSTTPLMIALYALASCFVLAFIVLFTWLGSRGQFLLLDNLVRNRGAIGWPWNTYARLGNSLFGFYLLYILIMLAFLIPFFVVGFFLVMPLFRQHRWPDGGEIPGLVAFGLVYLAFVLVTSVTLFLFRELGVPLMFRNGYLAREAFGQTWRLVQRNPGTIFIFLLLRFALFLALAVCSVLACCCFCLGAIPYIGTVMLLPAIIYIKCFTLDFLAQFGPEYDVWTVDVAPAATIPPQPPL